MSARLTPDDAILDRFRAALDPLVGPDERIGVAVSGGPDSLALLLLTAAVRPGMVEVATIDHGLRNESAVEAQFVAGIAAELGLIHHVLKVHVPKGASLQAQARGSRYRALGDWAVEQSLEVVVGALEERELLRAFRLGRQPAEVIPEPPCDSHGTDRTGQRQVPALALEHDMVGAEQPVDDRVHDTGNAGVER